jgi:psp operon transcriptional activator
MLLARHFAARMTAELGREFFPGFSEAATAKLNGYAWPGNVRELRNVVERSVYRMGDPARLLDEIVLNPFGERPAPAPVAPAAQIVSPSSETIGGFRRKIDHYERRLLQDALEGARFSQKQAAAELQLSYHQFRGLLKKHGLLG